MQQDDRTAVVVGGNAVPGVQDGAIGGADLDGLDPRAESGIALGKESLVAQLLVIEV